MSETFFTADTHFGHQNILKHEPVTRDFESIEEHNETLVANWNSVVGENDTVWHLGDIVWGKKNLPIISRLNGKIKLVLGNHDNLKGREYLDYVKDVYGVVTLSDGIMLSHTPIHPVEFDYRITLNLHGHLHSKQMDDPRYFNVGVDANELRPVNFDEILTRLERL